MTLNYEFSYQSPRQKIVLIGLKVLVAVMLFASIHSLGWSPDQPFEEKISAVGGIFIGFYVYANLLKVKTDVKELFIPPFDIFTAVEFMIIGGLPGLYHQFSIIRIILELKRLLH